MYFAVVVIMYVIINYANLDKVIAKRNVDRYFERSNIDIDYLLRELGTDAMPEIERLGRRTTDWNLQNRISKYYDDYVTHYLKQYNSFSEFNISRSKARKIVEED